MKSKKESNISEELLIDNLMRRGKLYGKMAAQCSLSSFWEVWQKTKKYHSRPTAMSHMRDRFTKGRPISKESSPFPTAPLTMESGKTIYPTATANTR